MDCDDTNLKKYSHLDKLFEKVCNEIKSFDLKYNNTNEDKLSSLVNKMWGRIEQEDEYDEVFKVKDFHKPWVSNKLVKMDFNKRKIDEEIAKQNEEIYKSESKDRLINKLYFRLFIEAS